MIGIILAGGKSVRFGGAASTPKPVVEVFGVPLVLRAAVKLMDAGATRICVLTGSNHSAVRAALTMNTDHGVLSAGLGRRVPFDLRYSGDDTGSAGRLLEMDAADLMGGALLCYSDVFTDAPLDALIDRVRDTACALGILSVCPRLPWGVVRSTQGRVTQFDEKPLLPTLQTNAGFYVCTPALLAYIHAPSEMLEIEPMTRMVAANSVCTWHHDGTWVSIDSPKDVIDAETRHADVFATSEPPFIDTVANPTGAQ